MRHRRYPMSITKLEAPEWHLRRESSRMELQLTGDWVACQTGIRSEADVHHIVDQIEGNTLRINSSGLGQWDSALIAFLKILRERMSNRQQSSVQIDESDLPEPAKRLLALASASRSDLANIHMPSSFVARVGETFYQACSEAAEVVVLVGETALRSGAAILKRARTRSTDVFQQVCEAGAAALGIVAVVNGLVGAIIAFVGAIQLRRFGAGIYIADLVGIGMAREMAAIMTGVVMAGRTGGAYAAHLATMQGNEEIDALKAFGIPVYDFLILPRIIALVCMMPLLYLYGCVIGILGGYVVSIATLDLTSTSFLEELRHAIAGKQFAIGLAKSVSFGALIALAACHIGLSAGRSAADVGHAATTAVVVGIVSIIILDAIFAVCTNALGI
jgi:phospholipid/cholesterol/gamma-HCH transport system permease protein